MVLTFAVRRLIRVPGFTIAAVLMVALGVGANTLAFSALRGMLVQPLPFPDADRIVWIFGGERAAGRAEEGLTTAETNALSTIASVEAIANVGTRMLVRPEGARRVQWEGLWVTPALFRVLGVSPAVGRAFVPGDMPRGASPAMLIGYERWQRDFGGDPNILGQILRFADSKSFVVIGVLPRGLEFPFGRAPGASTGSEFRIGIQDFWILGQDAVNDYPGGMTIARLRGDVTPAQAAADASARADRGRMLTVIPLRQYVLGVLRPALPLLQAFAALVLLIACANLAHLLLARATRVRTEFAIRAALGASRVDVIRILLAESLVISVLGGAAGIVLAWGGRWILVALAAGRIALVDRITLDATVWLFAFAICAATTIVVGLVPARGLMNARLVSDARGALGDRRQTRGLRGLVIAQIAAALVLLTAAALVRQSLDRLLAVDTGYDRSRVIAADVLLYERAADVKAFFLGLDQRLREMPGVEAFGLIQSTPLTGKWTFRERIGGVDVPGSFVAFDYFTAMGIPVVSGRTFTMADYTADDPRTIVINDIAARMFFPAGDAVGRQIPLFGKPREIVGVVKATRDVRLDAPAEPQWYQPIFFGSSQVLVRASGDPAAFAATLRRQLEAADPRLIVRRVEPLESIAAGTVLERRLATDLLTAFTGLALLLAIVGLYGIVSFMTTQRRREFGVRAALGADRRAILGMVLRSGMSMVAAGIAIGVAVSMPLATALEAVLFGIGARDPWTRIGSGIVLAIAAAAACGVPAWRAASVDPAMVLRAD